MAPDHDESLPTFAGFETLEKLGQGGMCEVYRVKSADGERAIKVLTDLTKGMVERFAAEARLLQDIDHANVLKVHALHDEAKPPWIEMELLAGKDLEENRRDEGPVGPERAARWFADLAGGLAEVHAHGVRHRDIKPANIMLGQDGVPRLIDFGIARQTNTAHVTRQGFVVGTASYLPPEIFFDDNSRDIQDSEVADVYALGQTLCEVLTGESVHPRGQAGGDAAVLVRIMKDKVERPHLDPREWLASCPDGLAEVVVRATKQEPEERLASATDLQQALRDWLSSRQVAEEAPITNLRPDQLPAPPVTPEPAQRWEEVHQPTTGSSGRTGRPGGSAARSTSGSQSGSAPRRAQRTATPAPAGRVGRVATGAAGVGGLMGIGVVALASTVLAAIGVWALYAYAPSPVPVDGIQEVLQAQVVDLAACQEKATGELVNVSLTSTKGQVAAVKASGKVDNSVWRCMEQVLEDGAWPAGDWKVTTPLQLP